jgi:GTP cyclohydrolase III
MDVTRSAASGFPPNSFGALVQAQRQLQPAQVTASIAVTATPALAQHQAKRAMAAQNATRPEATAPQPPSAAPSTASATLPKRLQRAYTEIEHIAQKAGYVGLSLADVERAYAYNTSLLVDYKA